VPQWPSVVTVKVGGGCATPPSPLEPGVGAFGASAGLACGRWPPASTGGGPGKGPGWEAMKGGLWTRTRAFQVDARASHWHGRRRKPGPGPATQCVSRHSVSAVRGHGGRRARRRRGRSAAGHARARARLARVTRRRQPARAAGRHGGRAARRGRDLSGMLLVISGRSLQWCARLAVWRDAAGPAPRVRWRWQTVTCHREGHDAAGVATRP
jgi:hypothetical protein